MCVWSVRFLTPEAFVTRLHRDDPSLLVCPPFFLTGDAGVVLFADDAGHCTQASRCRHAQFGSQRAQTGAKARHALFAPPLHTSTKSLTHSKGGGP